MTGDDESGSLPQVGHARTYAQIETEHSDDKRREGQENVLRSTPMYLLLHFPISGLHACRICKYKRRANSETLCAPEEGDEGKGTASFDIG